MKLIDKVLTGEYGDIFTQWNKSLIEVQYKKYCKELHPDVNSDPRATDAFARLGQLRDMAIQALDTGIWKEHNIIYFKCIDRKCILKVEYSYYHKTDVCEYYITEEHIVYVFEAKRKKYI